MTRGSCDASLSCEKAPGTRFLNQTNGDGADDMTTKNICFQISLKDQVEINFVSFTELGLATLNLTRAVCIA